MSEEQKQDEPVTEETAEEDLPSLFETTEDLKRLRHESVDRAKNASLNPVRDFAAELVDTVADGLDALFSVFERKHKRKRRPRE